MQLPITTGRLSSTPKHALAYNNRGIAKLKRGDLDGALADLKRANDRERQDYARLLIWLIRSRGGETDAANKELTACLDKQWNAPPDDWLSNVAR